MARSKGISYGRLIVKNFHTIKSSTCSQNTKIINGTTRFRMLPNTTVDCQARRSFCDLSGNQSSSPSPPPSSSSSSSSSSNWGKWTVGGIMVTIVLPFLQFKEDVDLVIETAEEVIDLVEVVAEAVDMVAEKIDDDLLEGSKIKTTVELVEKAAEAIVEEAQQALEFIDEAQAAEQKLNPIIEPAKQLTQVAPTEGN
ncbi:uncharacterized protein [Rutidosis leptorrhynchoides]|uniref:uncharacterized protein n=1 Tax=Rutidosis leptorrhynchoides TaxID=125765 RepID=UPI003A98CF54